MFDIGDINGSCVNMLTDKGCEQRLAANVKPNADDIALGSFLNQNSIRRENNIIPIVEPADNANEIETDV